MTFEKLVNNNKDSFNSYTKEQRERMTEGVQSHINDVKDKIAEVHKKTEAKKYPLKNAFSDASKVAGIAKRQEGFAFVNLIKPSIEKGNVSHQFKLTDEIKYAIERNDYDYASGLIEASEILLTGNQNSKLSNDLKKIADDYYKKIGLDYDETRKEIRALEDSLYKFEFILQAIQDNDDLIMFQEQFVELFGDTSGLPEDQKQIAFKMLPFVNKSVSFLSNRVSR